MTSYVKKKKNLFLPSRFYDKISSRSIVDLARFFFLLEVKI